jgi:hypothetical protein
MKLPDIRQYGFNGLFFKPVAKKLAIYKFTRRPHNVIYSYSK